MERGPGVSGRADGSVEKSNRSGGYWRRSGRFLTASRERRSWRMSAAAVRVKVTARMRFGSWPCSSSRATRLFRAKDFPAPGPATTRKRGSSFEAILRAEPRRPLDQFGSDIRRVLLCRPEWTPVYGSTRGAGLARAAADGRCGRSEAVRLACSCCCCPRPGLCRRRCARERDVRAATRANSRPVCRSLVPHTRTAAATISEELTESRMTSVRDGRQTSRSTRGLVWRHDRHAIMSSERPRSSRLPRQG